MGLGPTHLLETSFTAVSSMPTSLLPSSLGHSALQLGGTVSVAPGAQEVGPPPRAASAGLPCRRILGWVQDVCLAALAHEQPALPWSPRFSISWQHPQPRLRSSCPWALYGTWLFTALAEHLPLFPLCGRRCHLPATSVFAMFGPCCRWPVPFNKMCLAPPPSIGEMGRSVAG